jgi:hypothetical protein
MMAFCFFVVFKLSMSYEIELTCELEAFRLIITEEKNDSSLLGLQDRAVGYLQYQRPECNLNVGKVRKGQRLTLISKVFIGQRNYSTLNR